jgi:hypothetical protein
MRRPIAVCLVAALAGLAASGCTSTRTASSGKSFKGAQADVAKVVAALQTAGERRDATKACTEIFARALVAQLDSSGTSCAQEVAKTIKDVDDFKLDVRDVAVSGATATAHVRNVKTLATFRFVREANRWKVSELSKG